MTPPKPKAKLDGISNLLGAPVPAQTLHIFEEALENDWFDLHHLHRTLSYLAQAESLPLPFEPHIARHFCRWLCVINQPWFFPIITAPNRLRLAIGLLDELGLNEPSVVADVGTGQPPYTPLDLARSLPAAEVHGFDLYRAAWLVQEQDGSYGVFSEDFELRAIHADSVERLAEMCADYETTRRRFSAALTAPMEGQRIVREPVLSELPEDLAERIHLHKVSRGDFNLSALEDQPVDLIWSFNCLLHYPAADRSRHLAVMARRLAPGGVVLEGYCSPSGKHMVLQQWRLETNELRCCRASFTAANLEYPLWPLHDDDPQVLWLGKLIGGIKRAHPQLLELPVAQRAEIATSQLSEYGIDVDQSGPWILASPKTSSDAFPPIPLSV